MRGEWKERFEKIGVGIFVAFAMVFISAFIRGDELKGLSRLAALARILTLGVPLWLFVVVLLLAVFGGMQWFQMARSKKDVLHIVWKPEQCVWGTGNAGSEAVMQVITSGYFTNSAKDHRLIITSAYLEGTKPVMGMFEPLELEPQHCTPERLDAYVAPVIVKQGKRYKGKMVLLDQFGRKHRVPIELKSALPPKAKHLMSPSMPPPS